VLLVVGPLELASARVSLSFFLPVIFLRPAAATQTRESLASRLEKEKEKQGPLPSSSDYDITCDPRLIWRTQKQIQCGRLNGFK